MRNEEDIDPKRRKTKKRRTQATFFSNQGLDNQISKEAEASATVHALADLLRQIGEGNKQSLEALYFLKTNARMQAKLRGQTYRYKIADEEEVCDPSLLHDLADWIPLSEQEKDYEIIFNELINRGADPDAKCELKTYRKSTEVRKNTESVFDRALNNVNFPMISLLLAVYKDGKIVIDEEETLKKVVDDFVRHTELASTIEIEEEKQQHAAIAYKHAQIFTKMVNCRFKSDYLLLERFCNEEIFIPNCSILEKFRNEGIDPPADVPDTFFDIKTIAKLYPGKEKEQDIKKKDERIKALEEMIQNQNNYIKSLQSNIETLKKENRDPNFTRGFKKPQEESATKAPMPQL